MIVFDVTLSTIKKLNFLVLSNRLEINYLDEANATVALIVAGSIACKGTMLKK
jgi:hypothetical protein